MALVALLTGAVCIAMSPIFVRVSETGPTATAFWRVALAVPLLWVLYAAFGRNSGGRGAASRRPQGWLIVAAAVAFAGDLAFWHFSVKFTSVANSTLLANLAAIFVTLAAWLIFRQKPSRLFLVGLVTAMIGVAMLVSTSMAFSPTALAGDALGVVTAMFYAWYLLTVKNLRDAGIGTLRLMAITTALTAIILLPIALATGEQMLPVSTSGWLKLVGIALISHAGGQGLIAYALYLQARAAYRLWQLRRRRRSCLPRPAYQSRQAVLAALRPRFSSRLSFHLPVKSFLFPVRLSSLRPVQKSE